MLARRDGGCEDIVEEPWWQGCVLALKPCFSSCTDEGPQLRHSVFISTARYHGGSSLFCLLILDNQMGESHLRLPHPSASVGNSFTAQEKSLPGRREGQCRAAHEPREY